MKWKKAKKVIIWSLVTFLIVAILFVAGFVAYSYFKEKDIVNTEDKYTALAEQTEEISYDKKSGVLYMNNEIIVLAKESVKEKEMQKLASNYDAEISDADEDTGIYLLKLQSTNSLDELEELAEEIKGESSVDDAFINPVMESDSDLEDAVYPNDSWNGDNWTVDEPKGENWGAEAINAPGAWAYLDQLDTVNIGVIDTYVNTNLEDLDITSFLTVTDTESNYYETAEIDVSQEEADDHGCHVAGIIGAKWNNNVGISGIMGGKGQMYSSNAGSIETRENRNIREYYSAYEYVKAIKVLVNKDVRAINISQNTGRLIGFAASRGNKNAIRYLETQADIAERMLKRIINDIEANEGNDFVICISAGNSNNITYYKDDNSVYGYVEKQGGQTWLKNERGNSEAKYNNFLALIDDPDVRDRIIVVGAVRRNLNVFGSLMEEKYIYSDYSCVGDRVDIVAPGDDIYSLTNGQYASLSGTSMATPHVTAVAGLAFAANPTLSGPEVKAIVTAFSNGRYYYGSNYSGLVDAKRVVEYALSTKTGEEVVAPVSNKASGLDLCFIIDTTGSMHDDIENTKENMIDILNKLSEKTPDYRVALVDYRDFPERSDDEDYPAKVQLDFSTDNDAIISVINSLTLGDGGDTNETVYSAIHESLKLSWRPRSQKIVIILGDAPPLDPEPNTEYTYDDVIKALYNADIGIDLKNSDSRVLGEPDDSAISVYSIGINGGGADFFENIAGDTGGVYTEVETADEVTGAIVDSIDQIKLDAFEVNAKFGKEYSGETVNLYTSDDEYAFSFELNENGSFTLTDMPADRYTWKIERLAKGGSLKVGEDSKNAKIKDDDNKWYSFACVVWHRHKVILISSTILVIFLIIFSVVFVKRLKKRMKSKKMHLQNNTVQPAGNPAQAAPIKPKDSAHNTPSSQGCFCGQCGAKIDEENAKFCPKCGGALK